MNLRQLTIFQAVCQERGFTKAAQRLFMTQPAVSHVIADLEREANCRLFDRIGRSIYLTGPGELLLEKTNRLLALYHALNRDMALLEEEGPLRLGSSITIANTWLPGILQKFQNRSGKTSLQVTIDRASNIEMEIDNNKLDLALLEGPIHQPALRAELFAVYEMAAVCGPEHPFAAQKTVSLETFVQADLLLREKGSATRDTLDSALRLRDLAVKPRWTSVNSQTLLQGVRHHLGVSVLPLTLLQEDLEAGRLVRIEIEGFSLYNQCHLVYHPEKYLTGPMRIFMELVRQVQAQDEKKPS